MGVKGRCSAVVMGLVRWPMTALLTMMLSMTLMVSSSTAQSVAVREESATGTRQTLITVSATQAPLAKVLRDIAAQANLTVAFPGTVSQSPARVTLNAHEMPLDQVLAKVLDGTGIKATVVSGAIVFSESVSASTAPVAQGGIAGKVVDANTRQGLRGATVSLNGTNKGATTHDDGSFRFSGVVPGAYTVHVRMVGYRKATMTVTVAEGQTAVVEVVLAPSVNALDQVVVTGTVVATAQREIPNAMTVITARDIERRGITRVDQLFRGDVPGVFALNMGTNSGLDQVSMFSRGIAKGFGAGSVINGDAIKTYVDGVELADPSYLSQIDPKSIERIEILTGPQASTIYGSGAIVGVMQVFTKRGTSARPRLTMSLLSGWVQNNFGSALTPQHDDAAQVDGVEGHWSYNAGGSWNYLGPWSPGKKTSRLSGFGGARIQRDGLTADASVRQATTVNTRGGSPEQVTANYSATGFWTPTASTGLASPLRQSLVGQTLGLTVGYAPAPWWSSEIVLGQDVRTTEDRGTAWGYKQPSDTLLTLSQNTLSRRSLRSSTTLRVPLTPIAQAVISVGADAWQTLTSTASTNAAVLTGTLGGTPRLTRLPSHNTGAFVQSQIGFLDQVFVTYGLRAEWNPDFGAAANPSFAPRYGIAYSRAFGALTTKLRASYGRATRPPARSQKNGINSIEAAGSNTNSYLGLVGGYGVFTYRLPNPDLGPEFQQGGEGGLDMYFGNRGSLVVTRYNQTVSNLIAAPYVDSVRSIDAQSATTAGFCNSKDVDGNCYYRITTNANVGAIRNQGWEFTGTINTGPFATRGTYSWTKSRMIGISAVYRRLGVINGSLWSPGSLPSYVPEHTWAWGTTFAHAQTQIGINFMGTGQIRTNGNAQLWNSNYFLIRDQADRKRYESLGFGYSFTANGGYVMADLNATHRFSSRTEGVLQVKNIGDTYINDYYANYATIGRQTQVGLRFKW